MSNLKYNDEHEWVLIDGDIATIGISDYAQQQLGDVVFVELPDVGRTLTKGDEAAVVESVKAASEVYAPLTGEVVEVNGGLETSPDTINSDPQNAGWLVKLKLSEPSEISDLMDADAYKTFVDTL